MMNTYGLGRSKRITIGVMVAALAIAMALGMSALAAENGVTTPQTTAYDSMVNTIGTRGVAPLVKEAGPAVVHITTSEVQDVQDPWSGGTQQRRATGIGSGFFISEDGYIVTNEHVIHGADKIKVKVSGQDEPLTGKVIGSDVMLDIAVVKVEGSNFTSVPLGDSSTLEPGEWAVAIGNPYGLDHTVTLGVISGLNRPSVALPEPSAGPLGQRQYSNLIQTDAAINPGNSGGPLLNINGEVVGINTMINPMAQNLGFAIPINEAKPIIDQLIKNGRVVRPWIGIVLQELTPDLQSHFNVDQGVVVADVMAQSPGEDAGLQRGDVIITAGHEDQVKNPDQLVQLVQQSKVGERLVLQVVRNGHYRYVTVILGEMPRNNQN